MSTPVWEESKENVAPLTRGRDVTELQNALTTTAPAREAEKQQHEHAIREAAAGRGLYAKDPLAPWVTYVKWLTAAYPAGCQALIHAIQTPCRKFALDARYRDDARFVRLWIRYADLRDDKLDVFAYMRTKGIGANAALFYEGWATTLEFARQYDEAENVYSLGLERRAKPSERLARRQRDYFARMAARARRKVKRDREAEAKKEAAEKTARVTEGRSRSRSTIAEAVLAQPPDDGENVPPGVQPVRRALGVISEQQAETGVRPVKKQPLAGILRSGKQPLGNASKPPKPPSGGGFQIFSDPAPVEGGAVSKEAGGEEQFPFPSLATLGEVGKENAGKAPSKWAGETLSQNKAAMRKLQRTAAKNPTPAFEIFKDEPDEASNEASSNAVAATDEHHALDRDVPSAMGKLQRTASKNTTPAFEIFRDEPDETSNEARSNAVPATDERQVLEQNIPPPQSPIPTEKSRASVGAVSPTINTKIAMMEVDNMLSSTLPMEMERDDVVNSFSLSRPPLPAHQKSPAFSIYCDEGDDKENAGRPAQASPGGPSRLPALEARVLQPIPEMEGPYVRRDDEESLGPSQHVTELGNPTEMSIEDKLMDILVTWCFNEPNYHLLEGPGPAVEAGRMVLHPPNGEAITFAVKGLLGEGHRGISQVVSADSLSEIPGMRKLVDDDDADDEVEPVAIKASPNNTWEFYVYRTIHARTTSELLSVPQALVFFFGKTQSYLILDAVSHASMSQVLNFVPGGRLSEVLSMFFTVELLKTLDALHSVGIIHSDVTLGNVLLRNNLGVEVSQKMYNASGDGGWNSVGILLVDFNHATDSQHPILEGCDAAAVAAYTSRGGNEYVDVDYRMPNAKTWAFNADCYGAAVCSAKMLGLNSMNTANSAAPLKHADIWESYFSAMQSLSELSSREDTVRAMKVCREKMEDVLCSEKWLKISLSKLTMQAMELLNGMELTIG